MKNFDSLFIVGASGSGKSTLTHSLRIPKYENSLVVPHRYTTRPLRLGENPLETTNVDSETFFDMVDDRQIDHYYQKKYGPNHIHMYGFRAVNSDDRLRIYSGTGASIDRTSSLNMRGLLLSSYVVVLAINPNEHQKRLESRSPDMPSWEHDARINRDAEVALTARNHAHEIIDTGQLNIDEAQLALHTTVDLLVASRSLRP